jgi:hypothetical protein
MAGRSVSQPGSDVLRSCRLFPEATASFRSAWTLLLSCSPAHINCKILRETLLSSSLRALLSIAAGPQDPPGIG